jgi:hypothetical protein
LFHIR